MNKMRNKILIMRKIIRLIAIIMVMGLLAVSIPLPIAASPTQGGLVTLTFDHQYESTYQNTFPLLSQYGYQGVVYCISDMTNFDNAPFMSVAELADMRDAGWEIGAHTETHPYLTSLSLAEAEAEISASEQWIIDNGLSDDVISFAYPHGDANGPVMDIAERYFYYSRTTVEDINDYGYNAGLNGVLLWGNDDDNSLDFVKEKINEAVGQNKWAIVYTHGVTYDQDDWRLNPYNGDVSANVLRELLDFIQSTGVPVATFAQIEGEEENPPNHHPVANPDSYSVSQNDILTVAAPGVLGNDTDTDGDTLTAALVSSVSHGTLTLNADGSFTYTPASGYIGDDSFTYWAGDGIASSNTATVSITVTQPGGASDTFGMSGGDYEFYVGSNQINAQKFQNTAGTGTLTKLEVLLNDTAPSGSIRLAVYDDNSDTPGNLLLKTGEVAAADGWVAIDGLDLPVTQDAYYWLAFNMSRANSVVCDIGPEGSHIWYNYAYTAYPTPFPSIDGSNAGQFAMRATVTTGDNTPPLAVDDSYITNEDIVLNVAAPGILGDDTDADGDPLTAALVGGVSHGTLTLNADGSFTYTPSPNYNGIDSFTYKANDGQADSHTATVSITVTAVNDVPVAQDDTYSTNQDAVLNISAAGVLGNDTDIDGDPLTAALVGGVSHGTLTLNANGSFTYTPESGYVGDDSFSYRANDGTTDSNIATVSITVNPINDLPIADNDMFSINEDSVLSVAAPGVLGNDTDADGDKLTAALVGGVSHGTLTLNADGSFTYTPVADYSGVDSFTYKANDGQADSNTATVSITVTAVNDVPVAQDDTYTTDQDAVLNISAPGVLGNDTDIDGDPLTAIKVSDPVNGTLTLNDNGSFTYIPDPEYIGNDTFTYKANDGQADSNTATVSITINTAATTFGLDSGDNNWHEGADMIDVMRFQNTAGDGNITKLEILFDDTSPNGKVRLGVYADNNGEPGSLLLDAGEVVVSDGWVSISGLNLAVTQNTFYWLAFSLEYDNVVRTQAGQPASSHYWTNHFYEPLPSSYLGSNYNGGQYVMRATVAK